jgi:hypothetical protein
MPETAGLFVGDAENVHIWDPREPTTDKHRIRQSGIMVAGQDHDRHPRLGEPPSGSIENSRAQLIILEGIAGQQNDIRAQRLGGRKHGAQSGRAVAAMQRRHSAVVYVDVRAVDEDHLGRRRSHHATQTRSKSVRSVTGKACR